VSTCGDSGSSTADELRDNSEDFIMYPFEDGNGLDTMYDWNLWTVPQTYLDGKARPYDMGRGIGGGSIINVSRGPRS
jgi:hypothetical protein